MYYHEALWLSVTAAAPVIALADLVLIGRMPEVSRLLSLHHAEAYINVVIQRRKIDEADQEFKAANEPLPKPEIHGKTRKAILEAALNPTYRDPWNNELCVLQTEYPELLAQRKPWNNDHQPRDSCPSEQ